jgi:hypothetical protein
VNGFVLALAHHRLGQADEARKWLDRTVERLEQGTRGNENVLDSIDNASILDRRFVYLLRKSWILPCPM